MSLAERDLRHLWHPCSQMKDHEKTPLLPIASAAGCYLTLTDGRQLFDAISSWWCKSLGHGHPRLKAALLAQVEQFEHVILAGTTNETIVALSAKLASLMPTLTKVFYAGDGSCAVEIALKMSLHARQITGEPHRRRFLTLENGYHGETAGALSVSDVGIFREPYAAMLFEVDVLRGIPYVNGEHDPFWGDASAAFEAVLPFLTECAPQLTAVIFEPMVQGAGGMKIISADFLKRLCAFAKAHHIHVIADEIMTGFGRTGKMLASSHANIIPDFVCLSKGMTSGWLPLSAVLTSEAIYDIFYDDYASGKSFLHSHTYTGNALAAAVALEALRVMDEINIAERANRVGKLLLQHMQALADETGVLTNVRGLGAMVAADIIDPDVARRIGYEVFTEAPNHGVFLRPLGRTLYWLPPLIATEDELNFLANATRATLMKVIHHHG